MRSAIAPMYFEPHVRSTQISQRLHGHELEVIEEQDDWYLVRGPDGYEGWTHWGFLSPGNGQTPPANRISLGCIARTNGTTRALPLGARLRTDEVLEGGEAVDIGELPSRFPRSAEAIVRSAVSRFEGAPYLWGGVTPWGADCSGFVQSVFWLHGVQLPRDAWQQSESGRDAGALDTLVAGDLAFFSDREDLRVTHVALGMGERRLVHLALGRGGFAIEDLTETDDPYVSKLRERFLRARRVL